MAVRMSAMIQKELYVSSNQITYWTDSTTVLQWIKSETTRLHTFVSNHAAEIMEVSDPKSWKHVPGRLNAADDCSRGLSAQEILGDSRWIHGPKFLWKDQINQHVNPQMKTTLKLNGAHGWDLQQR